MDQRRPGIRTALRAARPLWGGLASLARRSTPASPDLAGFSDRQLADIGLLRSDVLGPPDRPGPAVLHGPIGLHPTRLV